MHRKRRSGRDKPLTEEAPFLEPLRRLVDLFDDPDFTDKQDGETPESVCKGKIYRCRINAFISPTTGQYVRTERMIPMKRLSCPDCEKCGYLDEYMGEDLHCAGSLAVEPDLEHGALYEFKITKQCRDLETGYVDDFEMAFVKLESE